MKLSEKLLAGYQDNLKNYEKYPEVVHKTYSGTKMFSQFTVEDGTREFIATITTDDLDRDGEVVDPRGGKLANYEKNPIITFSHDTWGLPIGAARWIKRFTEDGGRGIIARGYIAEGVEKAEDVFKLMQQKVLTTVSIGFGSFDSGPPTEEEIKNNPKWKNAKRVHRKWELFEFGVVGIPSNTSATIHAVSKGYVPDWFKGDIVMPDPIGVEPIQEPLAVVENPAIVESIVELTKVADVTEAPVTTEKLVELAVIETQERYETQVLGRVSL